MQCPEEDLVIENKGGVIRRFSIPHREDRNIYFLEVKIDNEIVFQFLIGKI